jgi:lipoprotein-releasing system permease protein
MNGPFKIALRYFFSKSQQTVINRINSFALILVIITSLALFVVLSAFDGLKDFGLSLTNNFYPDYVIKPQQRKTLTLDTIHHQALEKIETITHFAPEIEEKVFLSYQEKNQVAYLKGVTPNYVNVLPIESYIYIGQWLEAGAQVVAGFGIANALSLGINDFDAFLELIVPKKQSQSLLNQDPFKRELAYVVGLYQVSEELDQQYVFANASFAQRLLGLPENTFSQIALKVSPEVSKQSLLERIQPLFSEPIVLISRKDQNAALYKMLNLEHLAIYFIFTLVMIIALFNVIGALIMMILDKEKQLKILFAIGFSPPTIRNVFFFLGLLICGVGGCVGLVLGSGLVFIQDYFPFLYVPGTQLPYPVQFRMENLAIVWFTLMFLGTLSTAWACRGVVKKIQSVAPAA